MNDFTYICGCATLDSGMCGAIIYSDNSKKQEMKRFRSLSIASLVALLYALQWSPAQEIRLTTILHTDRTSGVSFAMKVKAPKGSTYYIDYGDGTEPQSKWGSGYMETLFYDFEDMDRRTEHQVRIWGADFLEFMVISNKEVTELSVTDCHELERFSCANSRLKELDLSGCSKLTAVICNNNEIARLLLPASVQSVNFSRNRLALADFPERREGMSYSYGPMRPVYLAPEKISGLTVDLSDMLFFGDVRSTFEWYYFNDKGNNADPAQRIDPATYSEQDGVFTFSQKPEKPIYCVVANASLPQLNNINDCYGIMPIELTGEDRKLEQVHVAFVTDKFTTEELTYNLTLTALQPGSPCTIDWGDGVFEDLVIGVDTLVVKHHFLDAQVDRQHTVQIECQDIDLVMLPPIGGLIQFAPTTGASPVRRLVLDNNRVDRLDLTAFINCEEISANGCYPSEVLLPEGDKLRKLSLRGGTLTSLDLSSYIRLEDLMLSLNRLETLDLSKSPHLQRIDVSHNKLKELKLSDDLSQLMALDCSYNALPMSMLPPKGAMTLYQYAPQEAFEITSDLINGCTIDLSAFDNLVGVSTVPQLTTYIWLHGDDDSKFIMEGVHYDVDGGKFKFKFDEPTKVFCTMQTAAFPDLASATHSYRTKPIIVPARQDVSVNQVELDSPIQFKTVGEGVFISTLCEVEVQIFSADGLLVWSQTVPSGEKRVIALGRGVYLLYLEGLGSEILIIK